MSQTSNRIESPSPFASSHRRPGATHLLIALSMCAVVATAVSAARSGGPAHADPLSIITDGSSTLVLAAPSAAVVRAEIGARAFDGGPIEIVERDVPAMGVSTLDLSAELALSPGIISLGADGDGPLVALGRTHWPDAGDALTTHGAAEASTELILPLAERFREGFTTYVAIQNTDPSAPAAVQVSAVKTQESRISASGEISIPAGESAGFWLGSGPLRDLPEGWLGAITLVSDRPVAAIAWVSDEDDGSSVFDVTAFPLEHAAPEWIIPAVSSQRNTMDGSLSFASSRIAIANPSNRIAILVTAELFGRSGACAGSTFTSATKTVRAGSMIVMDLGPDPDRSDYAFEVPADCEGSVRVFTSLGEVVVSEVEELWQGRGRRVGATGAPAQSVSQLGSRLLAPWRLSGGDSHDLGLRLVAVNGSDEAVTVAVNLHADDGTVETCAPCRSTLEPMGSRVWQAEDLLLSNGEAPQSVELASDGPIAAVVDEVVGSPGADRARFAVPVIPSGSVVSTIEHHPLLLASAALPAAPRAPTPTPIPTATPFPTSVPGPGPGPRPSSVPPGPVTPPTPIPTRTSSPTPTLVPTEVPLGDVVLQNLEPVARSLRLEVIAGDGSTAAVVDRPGVAASAAGVVDIATLADRLGAEPHAGFAGGADQIGALVVNTAARGAAAAYSAPNVAESLIIPAAYIDFGGRTTAFAVQNASRERSVNISVELVPYGRESFTRRATVLLPPGANHTYRLGESTDFVAIPAPPEGFSGWLRLVADGPIAAVADVTRSDRPFAAWSVQGVPAGEGAASHLVPAVYGGDGGLSTALHLFNPGGAALEARISYRGASATCADLSIAAAPVIVPAFSGIEVSPAADAAFAAPGCAAVAEIDADGPLIVDAAVHRGSEDTSAGFHAFPDSAGTGRAALPRVTIDVDGTSSRIWVANTDPSPVEAELRLFAADGAALACGAPCTLEIEGRGGAVIDVGTIAGLPSGYTSGEIVASAPIHAVVLDVPASPSRDLSAYEAIDASDSGARKALPLLNWTVRPGFVVGPTATVTPWPTSTIGPTPTPRPTIGPGSGPGPGFSGPFDIIGAQNLSAEETAFVGAQLFMDRTGARDTEALFLPADPWMLTVLDGRLGPIAPKRRAAWLTADQSIATWAMHGLESGGVFGHLGSQPGTDVVVPLLMAGLGDQWSTLHVQGAEESRSGALAVSIDILRMGSDEPLLTLEEDVYHGGYISVDMSEVIEDFGAEAGDPSEQVFAARIRADGSVAARAVVENVSGAGWAYDVAGTPVELAAERLIVPVLRSNFGRDNSSLFLYNPDLESATARLTYRGFAGSCIGEVYPTSAPIVIDAYDYRELDYFPGPDHPLSSGCEASLVVESDRALIGVVTNTTGSDEAVFAYPAAVPLEASEQVAIPRVHVNEFGRTSTLYITHAGDDSEDFYVWVKVFDGSGTTFTDERSLRPGETAKIDVGALEDFPAVFVGSSMILSDGPIVAVAVDEPVAGLTGAIGSVDVSRDTAAWRGAPAMGPLTGLPEEAQPLPIAVWAGLSKAPDPTPTPTPFVRPTPIIDPAGIVHLPYVVSNAAGLEPDSTAESRPRPTATPPTPTRRLGGSSAESIWP